MGLSVHLVRGLWPFGGDAARLGALFVLGMVIYAGVFYGLDPSGFRRVVRMIRDILVPR
jgi:hypothetical protein